MAHRVPVQAWQLRVGDVIAGGWERNRCRVTSIEVVHTVPKRILLRTVYLTKDGPTECTVCGPRREFMVLR